MFTVDFKNSLKKPKNFALFLSIILHVILALLLIINFATFKNKDIPNQVKIVELVFPISNKTNLPPAKTNQKKTEENLKEKKEPKKEVIKPTPSKEIIPEKKPKQEPEKEVSKPDKKDNKQPLPKEKKTTPVEKSKENKKKDDSMDDLLKSLEGQVTQKNTLESELESLNSSNSFDDSLSLSISEIDAIKSQIQKCWTEPAGGLKKEGLSVLLKIKLLIDGSVEDIKVSQSPRTDNIIMNQLATDTAIRAIKMCAPYKMPMNSYNSWKELEIMFDPKKMQ